MVNSLKSWIFVAELALIRDVLEALQSLPLFLQNRMASIINVKNRFDSAMRTLLALKSVDGLSLTSVRRQIAA